MIKAAVIGTGAMGRNHARVYAELPDVALVGVADIDRARAEAVALPYKVKAYDDVEAMLSAEKPDVVSIAVPASLHLSVSRTAMAHGCHLLVEKPVAHTSEDGKKLLDEAAKAGILLTVGHIERFNPALEQLAERLKRKELGALHYVEARRQGPFPTHISDVGAIIDIAVHDLDILSFVTGRRIDRVYAETKNCVGETADVLTSVLHMEGGLIGNINVNWITPTKIRELYITGEAGTFHVNYITQDLTLFQNPKGSPTMSWEAMGNLRGVSEGDMIRYQVHKEEPLKREIRAFLAAVQAGGPPPVPGDHALQALWLAELLTESGRTHAVLAVPQH